MEKLTKAIAVLNLLSVNPIHPKAYKCNKAGFLYEFVFVFLMHFIVHYMDSFKFKYLIYSIETKKIVNLMYTNTHNKSK